MLKESLYNRIGLQFFAADGAGSGAGGEGGAAGTDGGQGGTDGTQTGSGAAGSQGTGAKTFTQEDVNRMMANEKRTARSALLKELGYEVKDGKITETVATIKGILDQGKTQQQLDQEARTTAETNLAEERSKNSSLQARVDVMTAGVKPEFVDDAIAMLLPQVTEQKSLSKLLEEYKTKYPAWYGESSGSGGTGNSTKNGRNTGGTQSGLGKRLAESNKSAAKSSYFKN
jgi:hypothetical protein